VDYPKNVKDQLGRKVVITRKPERIISLAPANTEIVYALGADDKLVGVTEYCDYPVEARKKDKVGGYSTVDIKKIMTLKEEQKPRVFYIHEHPTWKTFGSGTIGDTLTEMAGGINIGKEFGEYYPYPEIKEVIKKNPDVIVVETGYGKNADEPLDAALKDERLTGMDARRNGRVYGVNSDYISRTGPRIIDGLEILARLFHPELFYSNK